jgi:hypothetical protein
MYINGKNQKHKAKLFLGFTSFGCLAVRNSRSVPFQRSKTSPFLDWAETVGTLCSDMHVDTLTCSEQTQQQLQNNPGQQEQHRTAEGPPSKAAAAGVVHSSACGMSQQLPPFHLAFPVHSVEAAREFYGG